MLLFYYVLSVLGNLMLTLEQTGQRKHKYITVCNSDWEKEN